MNNLIKLLIITLLVTSCFPNLNESNSFDNRKFSEQVKKDIDITLPEFSFLYEKEEQSIGDKSLIVSVKFDSLQFCTLQQEIERAIASDSINFNGITRWKRTLFGYRFEEKKFDNILIQYCLYRKKMEFCYQYFEE